MTITTELPQHARGIEQLLDLSFGANRTAKTAYRLREAVAPIPELCFVALDEVTGALDATIRYWPILAGEATPSLLLGPIAVAPHKRSEGLGAQLIRLSLERAADLGWQSVLLVGDAPYYKRFGFTRDLTLGLSLPGPVDLDRFLGLELVPGALKNAAGMVGRWPETIPPQYRPAEIEAPTFAPVLSFAAPA